MKHYFTFLLLIFLFTNVHSQEVKSDIKLRSIEKQVKEFSNKYDLSTPLNSFITFKYLKSEGKQKLYRSVNSYRIKGAFPKENAPDARVKDTKKEKLLNTKIREIIVYKDSIACVITDYTTAPMCIITYLSLEDGKWLNAGEDLGNDLADARKKFKKKAKNFLHFIHRIKEFKNVPTDTKPFVDYLKKNAKAPKEFLLNALASHKIVVYGEIHRRKTSWDLWKTTIKDPSFVKNVGTVFMELSSDKQKELDTFFANKELDTEIILDIFREVQFSGWYDKGMYEFIIELWKLNKKLPKNKQIRVVIVDIPRPFHSFKSKEEMRNHFKNTLDRNEQMATIIAETIKTQHSNRNNLFIVGAAHAYKSAVPGIGVGRPRSVAKPTAVAQLVTLFSDKDVFTIFPHTPILNNNGSIYGKIRNGMFDKAFAEAGNKAMAFNLKDSPFGKEPFGGLHEIAYDRRAGSYEDNYDAYMFLEPLESEQDEYFLYELISDKFVKELERRAKIIKTKVEKWFEVEHATKEEIVTKLRTKHANQTRWIGL